MDKDQERTVTKEQDLAPALSSSELLRLEANDTALSQFGKSFSYSLLQGPLDGISQLIDGKAGGKTEKAMHFMDAPAKAEFGSTNWVAQESGAALGAILPALAIHRGISSTLGRGYSTKAALAMSENMSALTASQAMKAGSIKMAEAGLTGMIYAGVLSPVSESEENFWQARMRNSASGALTFATLSGTTMSLKAAGERGAAGRLSGFLASDLGSGALSGIPAGLVAANADSVLAGKGFAERNKQIESALTFSLLGAGFAWGKQKLAESSPPQRQTQAESNFKNAGVDVDGRSLNQSKRAEISSKLPDYSQSDLSKARFQTFKDLLEIKALEEGKSVGQQLRESGLSITQKYRVLNSLAQVREHFVKQESNGKIDPDQQGNWIHTQGELGRVLDAAKQNKLSALQIEDSLLASMFADSVKNKGNFFTHHIDGALAADHILQREVGAGFNRGRLDGIVHAIREHQIGPPEFMSELYAGRIRAALSGKLDASQESSLASLKSKIADPLNQETYRTRDGGSAIKLSGQERALLELSGLNEWYVPEAKNPWNKVSRAVIDGDTLDNYYTPGGIGKITGLGGPESDKWFMTRRLDSENVSTDRSTNIGSARNSARDAGSLLTPESRQLAQKAVAQTEAAIAKSKENLKDWLISQKGVDPSKEAVPFFNKDLKYPNFGDADAQWWNIHRTPLDKRSLEQQKFYEQHRFDGLSLKEQAEFLQAKEIRDRAAAELRAAQRLDGKAPKDYKASSSGKR